MTQDLGTLVLPFLPLLPSQVLLNNLLYDVSEMTIPTDRVDKEQLHRPAHWDTRMIGRFMLGFDPGLFRAGYFAESFLTQTLIVFAIRTRRVPFFAARRASRWRPRRWASRRSAWGLTFSPWAGSFGFARLDWAFVPILAAIVVGYTLLVEVMKAFFFRRGLGSRALESKRLTPRSAP